MVFLSYLLYFILIVMSAFLICLVLIQRGKGGGLAGAFGGPGGSSAFGSKAGDVFTRVTMVAAGIWIVLNMLLVVLSNQKEVTWGDTDTVGSASKSAFTPSADGKDGKAATTPGALPTPGGPESKSPTAPTPATTGPALAPGTGAPAKGAGAAAPDGLPADVFAPTAPTPDPRPAGSTTAPGGTGPKP